MISDDEIRARLETVSDTPNSSPVTRGNPSKSARRGTEEFDDLMDELENEWELDEEELDNIVELRRAGDSFEIRMKGEDRWELLEDDGPEGSDDEDSDDEEPEDSGGEEEEG